MLRSLTPTTSEYRALDFLTVPVWIVDVRDDEIVFTNKVAEGLSGGSDLHGLRHGNHSAHAEEMLLAYLPALRANEQIVEIWTIHRKEEAVPLSCQFTLLDRSEQNERILVEGILSSLPMHDSANRERDAPGGLYAQLFHANGAPMLLIDPAADGVIVDANLAACRFYGFKPDEFCKIHTWQINVLGRQVLPIMGEVAKLPGGHRPLNFTHRLADGSLRDVQTYASRIELDGKQLMLCVIHDVTAQKRLRDELEYAATRDPLTGLWNRRRFLNLLEKAQQQKRRHDLDYCLLILDADHFKKINDQFGHDKGDEVLVCLAKTLESGIRDTDTVCRWGGEEFIILLPQTDIKWAVHLAQRLRRSVAEIRVPGLTSITVSIGVAEHQTGETTENLLKRADAALYQAKAAGRDKVVVG